MDREKFQQKALKQTKQKKYKSAEFLMVKGGRDATEGIGNPAFNMSSPDLSAHQTSKEKVIKHDMLDHTLASHQQKRRLPASTEPKGNECCRNYFDPLTEEEINPRQCRMEVSREGELELRSTDERTKEEDSDSGSPMSPSIISDTYKEPGEANPADIEESERQAQRDIILMANPLLEQDLKFQREGISQDIPMSHLKMDRIQEIAPNQPFPADGSACKGARGTKLGSLTDVTGISMGAREAGCEGAGSQSQQPLQIQIKCIRGLKDKAPHGFYLLRVSLLDRPGSWVLQGWQTEQLKTRTHPVHHGGSFYDVGLYLNESLYVVLPQRKAVKPGCSFLFELVLLHGTHTYVDQVVGWAVFPVHDNYFHIVEGKFKCPLLRGPYDQKLGNFRKVEDFICQDLDHWLCNLYFQVSKLPLYPEDKNNQEICTQPSPAFPVNLMEEAEEVKLGMNNTAGCWEEGAKENTAMKLSPCNFIYKLSMTSNSYSIKLPKLGIGWENSTHTHIGGSLSNKIDPCPTDCDLHLLKEARDLHIKGHRSSTHSVKEKSTVCRPREFEDYLQDTSFLEELEKHRVSVFSSSTVGTSESGEFSKHLYFAWLSLSSELELAQWQSQGFWYIILLMVSLCFLRLYLHYVGQWLLLQAISTPVTKFRFHPHTVDLCYPTSSLRIGDELAVIVLGPLMLNTVIFLLLLIRWGCQLLFSSGLDALSKLIITMGVWTVLDPLAVFIVDIFLGRFTRGDEETPTADAAKLYWMFVNTKQPPILGAVITVIAYILLFIISSLMLYVYCLRLHNDSWILDVLQRIHSEENRFFMPHDLEMSNQELSYIVKRSEQWRGLNSERREVAVYDYICNSHGTKTSVSSCDLQHQISVSALGPGDISSHISVYNVYPSGFHELYRHFLRLPGGAIIEVCNPVLWKVETRELLELTNKLWNQEKNDLQVKQVFGDISALAFVPREVTMAIEEHIRATDTVQGETVATHEEKWKGTIKNRRRLLAPMEG